MAGADEGFCQPAGEHYIGAAQRHPLRPLVAIQVAADCDEDDDEEMSHELRCCDGFGELERIHQFVEHPQQHRHR